jgi:PAS domain S-box-containing protein
VARAAGRVVKPNYRRGPHGPTPTLTPPDPRVAALASAEAPLPLRPDAVEAALAAVGVGVWALDLDTRKQWWSDALLVLYGLPPGSPSPDRDTWTAQFLHPEDLGRVQARMAEYLREGRPYAVDFRIRRTDGELRWLHSRATSRSADRRRLVGATLDITDRKMLEARAGEALSILDFSAAQIGFGVGYRDLDGSVAHWSAQLKLMYGFDPAGPTPSREAFLAAIALEDRDRVASQRSDRPSVGPLEDLEYTLVRPSDGQARRFLSRAVVIGGAEGRPARRYYAVVDVTESRQREREMAELLERLQFLTQTAGVGTWERDARTGQALWDATMKALYGLDADAPAPDSAAYLRLIHPEDRARMAQERDRFDRERNPIDFEMRAVRPDGAVRWLQVRGRTEFGEDGRPLRRLGICFDVTERHEAEAARRAQALAERANAAKTEFLSRMSHELRTPLNAVLGFAQILASDGEEPLTLRQRERLGHIQNAGWHLLALINDVLDLTRIETQQLGVEMGEVDLLDAVAQSLALNSVAAGQRHVRLEFDPDPRWPATAWADRRRLVQLLVNLVSNAVKYNVEGGRVEVTLRALGEDEVQVAVRDTGLGLTEAQQAQLFQPFNRLGREHSGIEGTGIGLTLSRLLAEQMGGRITLASRPGEGSEFSVVLRQKPPALHP